jgi:hypothetical protein
MYPLKFWLQEQCIRYCDYIVLAADYVPAAAARGFTGVEKDSTKGRYQNGGLLHSK